MSTLTAASPQRGRTGGLLSTAVLVIGALYCLVPIAWVVVASTKSPGELFTTFTFQPGSGLIENLTDLLTYSDGAFIGWAGNTFVYAGLGAMLCTLVSAAAGYALARFEFGGKRAVHLTLLASVLVPGIALAIPQYMVMAQLDLTNTMWSVLLPSIISPFGIYLAMVFAAGAVPVEVIESGRMDGAGEGRIFMTIVLPMMLPGLVTVFLLQFVGIWNNFLLPFLMLSDDSLFPLTMGLFNLLNRGANESLLYTLAIAGSALSVLPLIALVLVLQRFWRLDLLSGGTKG
ncbi:carbohydrate ABC transporter permease [Pseudonocardia sp. MH-G8]|uniref:carbohydrate ABC transporter permease n=1 Tax=Pseudonocardia sp. MH-G8 TaxID=1854588 RepID=UPI000BA16A82|nr:carbohydrate ABC transporter permease [Pseudonocardia sp. MH-G8]OZM75802.1 sugar ABC transporter permease [Pseudonocardia sp. MH-G8]